MTTMTDFIQLVAQLRHPEKGCPWDLKQDFDSMLPHLLEETYEVAEAIHTKDRAALREELGDLLLQVVFLSRLSEEEGTFSFQDVLNDVFDKLIRRHPHVFGDQTAGNSEEALSRWEEMKAVEKAQKSANEASSILDDLPFALPALTRAHKLQKRCAKVGFDWASLPPVLAKVEEELEEVKQELEKQPQDREKLGEELGDLLFATVNLCRHCQFEAESNLRHANVKFENRFRKVEKMVEKDEKNLSSCSLDELDNYWNQIKLLK
ncbi:nucleoside triphosphate pyrophosphohydrolase [Pasteurellaceae bacterium RH1A]|nr:nucleoside triphosphate pyrophosphohydrolase [Pasteurellaceae bacterium RH1A]